MRIICSGFLLLLALSFPLLLDGQTFTNDLFGIAFAEIAVALSIKIARGRQAPSVSRLAARLIYWTGVIVTLLLITMLPTAYRHQAGFNRTRRELHQRANKAAADSANVVLGRGR